MSEKIEKKKQKIKNKIERDGSIPKINKKETKPFQQNTDVLLAYEDKDVVLTYNNQRYTQGQLKEKFEKVEYFMKLDKRVLVRDNKIVKTKFNDTIEVLTLPNKANNSPTKSRRIPRDYVIIKYKEEEGAVAVPKSIFFTNPIAERRDSLIVDYREYNPHKFNPKQKCEMIRYLAETPEFKGDTTTKYKSFGNNDYKKLSNMDDKTILSLEGDLKSLHKDEVAYKKLQTKNNRTAKDIKRIVELKDFIDGRNEEIKIKYNFSSRGTLTDLRVWFGLITGGKNPVCTYKSKFEGIQVIPKVLSYKMVHRMTSKKLEEVWKQI